MAAFRYEAYRNPYVGSISDLMMRPAEAEAAAALEKGRAWAGALNQSGQAATQAIQQEPQRQMQALQLDQMKRGAADQSSLDTAYSPQSAMGPGAAGPTQPGTAPSRQQILDALPGHLKPIVTKQFTDADEAAAKVQETQLKASEAQNDYLGGLGATIRAHNGDPAAVQLAFDHAKDTYASNPQMLQQITAIQQRIQQDPSQLPVIVDALVKGSNKQQTADAAALTAQSRVQQANTGSARLHLETPKIQADTQKVQQEVAGTQPISPFQQKELDNRAAVLKLEQGKAGLEQAKFEQGKNDKTDLTPEGLDAAAMMFAKTGQLPALGMGDKTTRKAIINRAAVMVPGLDIASAKADFGANQNSLKNVTGTLDNLTAFENTAGKNLDQFLKLAAKIPDTGVPWLNTPVRLVNDKMVGSDNQAAFNAARDVALREIARVTNDPKLSGVLSDSARQEVSGLSPKDATFAQIKKVADVLKQDMANVHSSLSDQRDAIQNRIKLGSTTPPAAPPPAATPSEGQSGTVNGVPAVWKTVNGKAGWYAK